jgi:hypothetical protein
MPKYIRSYLLASFSGAARCGESMVSVRSCVKLKAARPEGWRPLQNPKCARSGTVLKRPFCPVPFGIERAHFRFEWVDELAAEQCLVPA